MNKNILLITFILGMFLLSFATASPYGYDTDIIVVPDMTTNIYFVNDTELVHNNMSGLQGGNTSEYYHINATIWSYLLENIYSFGGATEPLWTANYTAFNDTWNNITNFSYYLVTNPQGYWNDTYALFNETWADGLYSPIDEPYWSANYTLYNDSWSSTTNTSYAIGNIMWSNNTETVFINTGYPQNVNITGNLTVTSGPSIFAGDVEEGTALGYDNVKIGTEFSAPRILFENVGDDTWGIDNYDDQFRFYTTAGAGFPVLSLNSTSVYTNEGLYVVNNTYVTENVSASYFVGSGYWLTDLNITNHSYYLITNSQEYWNDTYATFNETWADGLYSPIDEPLWTANYTAFNDTWNNITNYSYYLAINPFGFYNSTNPPTEPLWSSNQSAFNDTWNNITNYSYYLVTNPFGFYNSTDFVIIDYNTTAETLAAILATNTTMKTYVDSQDGVYNTSMKDYVDAKLITIFYNATAISAVIGNPSGLIGNITAYDSLSLNVTEVSSDIDFRINFTSIPEFNQLIVRYKSSSSESHTAVIQIYNYDDSVWEDYRTIGNTENNYVIDTMTVYDADEHVSGEVVQVRFYSINGGGSTHLHQFDWVSISKGPATPSSDETDPFAVHTDGNVPLIGNWDAGEFNISAQWFDGLMNASNITNAPWLTEESETLWNANYSTFLTHITWANAVNGTLLSQADWDTNYSTNDAAWRLDTDTFAANYSTFLTHITWANAINGTLFSQADWDTNYTANNANWLANDDTFPLTDWETNYTANNVNWLSITNTTYRTVYNTTFLGNSSFDTDVLFVDSVSNQVGIGTTSPETELHVKGVIHITDPSATRYFLEVYSSGGVGWIDSYDDTGNDYEDFMIRADDFIFKGEGTERFRITDAGNVGIGTSVPNNTLHVEGTGNFSDNITTSNYITFTGGGYMFDNGTALVFGRL